MKLSPLHFQLLILVIEKQLANLENMTILGYSCGLQSSLYTKNHRFTLKALIFLHQKFNYKKSGSPGKLIRYFKLAQLAGGGLGRSKPTTNLMQAQ
jgi:hypothetical protein